MLNMKEIIDEIVQKHHSSGIEVYDPATVAEMVAFEEKIGFPLPKEFREFYSICNGFGCSEDIFNMLSLTQITHHSQDYGSDWFYFPNT